jgi:integrase
MHHAFDREPAALANKPVSRFNPTLCIAFDSIRHLNASLLTASQPIPVVAQRLGHSRPDVTLRTYSHILPGQDQAAAEALDTAIG